MTACAACANALRFPESGVYQDACTRCRARYFSTLPQRLRESLIHKIEVDQGHAVARQIEVDVQDEFVRREGVRRARASDR